MERDRRRRIVHLLIGINGAGFVLIGTGLAGAFKAGTVPWFGLAAVAVMFLGVVVPFYREFVALRVGFEEVERETMRTIKRRQGDEPGLQETLDAGSRPNPFTRVRSQPLTALALTVLGWGLAAVEGSMWLARL